MPYHSKNPRLMRLFLRAHSCPWLILGEHCAGGDYCPFPPGSERLCCFFCPRLDGCPDNTGICERLEK
jgi:hypothetical protein